MENKNDKQQRQTQENDVKSAERQSPNPEVRKDAEEPDKHEPSSGWKNAGETD